MTFVADTHAIVWHLTEQRRLGRGARRLLRAAGAGRDLCYVPAISVVEITLLHEKGRLRVSPARFLETLAGHGVERVWD